MNGNLTYLDDCSEGFVRSCDVLLKLDDGSVLPAHSQILARYSGVFASMLDDGPLSDISATKKATVPLSDCSRATAISLLSVLYTGPSQPMEHIKWVSSMLIANLAHKLDMKDVVRMCDNVISGAALQPKFEEESAMSSAPLQAWAPRSFRLFLDDAVRFEMRKLLACYEHCIAMDHSGKFNDILQHFPPQSVVRITKYFRRELSECQGRCHHGVRNSKPVDFLQIDPGKKSSTGQVRGRSEPAYTIFQ